MAAGAACLVVLTVGRDRLVVKQPLGLELPDVLLHRGGLLRFKEPRADNEPFGAEHGRPLLRYHHSWAVPAGHVYSDYW